MSDDIMQDVEINENELMIYGEIFYQMIQRPWFKEFIDTRFDFQKHIDEEERTIELRVIEVPMEVTMQRLAEIEKAKADAAPKIVEPSAAEIAVINRKG